MGGEVFLHVFHQRVRKKICSCRVEGNYVADVYNFLLPCLKFFHVTYVVFDCILLSKRFRRCN